MLADAGEADTAADSGESSGDEDESADDGTGVDAQRADESDADSDGFEAGDLSWEAVMKSVQVRSCGMS